MPSKHEDVRSTQWYKGKKEERNQGNQVPYLQPYQSTKSKIDVDTSSKPPQAISKSLPMKVVLSSSHKVSILLNKLQFLIPNNLIQTQWSNVPNLLMFSLTWKVCSIIHNLNSMFTNVKRVFKYLHRPKHYKLKLSWYQSKLSTLVAAFHVYCC